MPIQDKIATAKKISELLNQIIQHGAFRLKYKITVDPPIPDSRDWEKPVILVELSGADSPLMLERGAEVLRALECIVMESLRLSSEDHDKVAFDCMNFRQARIEELRLAASVAAEKVRHTKEPYSFAPMSSRERRVLHLALRDEADLRTESAGEGPQRHLILYPKDYKGKAVAAPTMRRRR
ncbi:MAG TPA: R3H domain-containing nucleic acid-binding protein [Clostridia bacterium]|nr:R3H domain-containing nucleic acid-binding protein [Clostridia bacterium]